MKYFLIINWLHSLILRVRNWMINHYWNMFFHNEKMKRFINLNITFQLFGDFPSQPISYLTHFCLYYFCSLTWCESFRGWVGWRRNSFFNGVIVSWTDLGLGELPFLPIDHKSRQEQYLHITNQNQNDLHTWLVWNSFQWKMATFSSTECSWLQILSEVKPLCFPGWLSPVLMPIREFDGNCSALIKQSINHRLVAWITLIKTKFTLSTKTFFLCKTWQWK